MYKNAIFDVDGTILDSFEGVGGSVRYTLEKMGKPVLPDEILRKFIGPSLNDSFSSIAGFKGKKLQDAIDIYRARYESYGIYQGELFEGYPELFERLSAKGVILCAASTKPQEFLTPLFVRLGLTKYFERIIGPSKEANTSDKTEYIKAARVDENAVMVGDRKYDIFSARSAGVDVIGVTYGFAEEGEFEKYKPDYVAKDTNEIYEIIINNSRRI